jgi:hypothetical protein
MGDCFLMEYEIAYRYPRLALTVMPITVDT